MPEHQIKLTISQNVHEYLRRELFARSIGSGTTPCDEALMKILKAIENKEIELTLRFKEGAEPD